MAAGIEITQAGSTSHVVGRLAKETGGFVIENTNDLEARFRRIDANRRFHDLLTAPVPMAPPDPMGYPAGRAAAAAGPGAGTLYNPPRRRPEPDRANCPGSASP